MSGDEDNALTGWMAQRLDHMERVLSEQEWLAAGRFTVADLLMADVLRIPAVRAFGDRPATEAYVARVTDRPSFKKAHADQIGHFEAADQQVDESDSHLGIVFCRSDSGMTNAASRLSRLTAWPWPTSSF